MNMKLVNEEFNKYLKSKEAQDYLATLESHNGEWAFDETSEKAFIAGYRAAEEYWANVSNH